jgi:hypothetical protein
MHGRRGGLFIVRRVSTALGALRESSLTPIRLVLQQRSEPHKFQELFQPETRGGGVVEATHQGCTRVLVFGIDNRLMKRSRDLREVDGRGQDLLIVVRVSSNQGRYTFPL